MTYIEHWNSLTKAWRDAEGAAQKVQADMDACLANHLSGGDCPTAKMQEEIDELRFLAYNARGLMDEFISERLG